MSNYKIQFVYQIDNLLTPEECIKYIDIFKIKNLLRTLMKNIGNSNVGNLTTKN